MAKTYDDNLRSPRFKKLLEKSKFEAQQGNKKKAEAAYNILSTMNLTKNENNPDLFSHIPDRQLGEMIGVSKGTVCRERNKLKAERFGIEKVVEKVDTSKMKIIGSGSEFVYLYYFPTNQLFNKLCLKVPYFPCNIGRTTSNVKERVSQQIGDQLPEKPILALCIKTDDCETLETEIHKKLKRENLEDAIGTEWFLTNPAEVEGIVNSIHSTKNSNE